jgi:thioredoxin reductase (NADPH)
LKTVVVKDTLTGAVDELHPAAVFVFIGLNPNVAPVKNLVTLDPYGYIVTGHDLVRNDDHPARAPLAMETSVPGIFAAGDVRHGSSKRVAAAVGEGSSVVGMVHKYLETV